MELTEPEYKSLVSFYGKECTDYCIEELNRHRGEKGWVRIGGTNDFYALKGWPRVKWEEKEQKKKQENSKKPKESAYSPEERQAYDKVLDNSFLEGF